MPASVSSMLPHPRSSAGEGAGPRATAWRAFQVGGSTGPGWPIAEPPRPPFSAWAAVGLPQPLGPSLVQEDGGGTDPLKRDGRSPPQKKSIQWRIVGKGREQGLDLRQIARRTHGAV